MAPKTLWVQTHLTSNTPLFQAFPNSNLPSTRRHGILTPPNPPPKTAIPPHTNPNTHRTQPRNQTITTTRNSQQQHPPPTAPPPITPLPTRLTRTHTNLSPQDHALLLTKQTRLRLQPPTTPPTTLPATLIFAHFQAGTAVCIHPSGLLLTCAHCVAETEAELDLAQSHVLLFVSSGAVVIARCVAWDGKRDLALLRVEGAQGRAGVEGGQDGWFPAIEVGDRPPALGARLVCIGQPGSEDLECEEAGVETGYEVVCVSEGRFRGYAEGQDVQDNEEIGALMHTCWTYWGHSGAPLVEIGKTARMGGMLVGLHSSWDEETGMRRGWGLRRFESF